MPKTAKTEKTEKTTKTEKSRAKTKASPKPKSKPKSGSKTKSRAKTKNVSTRKTEKKAEKKINKARKIDTKNIVINVGSKKLRMLHDYLQKSPDHRSGQGKRYPMSFMLTMVAAANMSGYYATKHVRKFGSSLSEQDLKDMGAHFCSKTQKYRSPAVGTIHNFLKNLDSEKFHKTIRVFERKYQKGELADIPMQRSITGATKNASVSQHIQVAAFQHNTHLILDQKPISNKREAADAAREMIRKLHCKNKLFTIDSAYSQNVTAKLVREKQADYIFTNIHKERKVVFEKIKKINQKNAASEYRSYEKRNRYIIKQKFQAFPLTSKKKTHKSLMNLVYDCKQCIKITTQKMDFSTRKNHTYTTYAVTSLSSDQVPIENVVLHIKSHLYIKNSLEYLHKDTSSSPMDFVNKDVSSIMSRYNNLGIAIMPTNEITNARNHSQRGKSSVLKKHRMLTNAPSLM